MSDDNLLGFSMQLRHSCFPNGDIIQEALLTDGLNDTAKEMSHQLIKTSDAAVRKSLIALGWTPPGEQPRADTSLSLAVKARERIASIKHTNFSSFLDCISWARDQAKTILRIIDQSPEPAPPTPSVPEPRGLDEPRGPIGSSYPLAYRLVAHEDGDGKERYGLQGLYLVHVGGGRQRCWVDLLTQDALQARDSIPSFLPI